MKKSFNGNCFQCGEGKTTIKMFIDDEHKGYFCDIECLEKLLKKKDPLRVKAELFTIISNWIDMGNNECYYTCICGLLAETENDIRRASKSQALLAISRSKDENKLRSALKYVKTVGGCVIL